MKKPLVISCLRTDGATQPRASINQKLVKEYAECYAAKVALPPVVVFYDGKFYWLADGFHRREAAYLADQTKILCEIRQGTQQDAQWYSYAANQAHGSRRTTPDKQRAVKAALLHPKGAELSDRQIAEYLGVSHCTVAKGRKNLESSGQIGQIDARTVRRGEQEYKQDTTNIGKGKGRKRKATAPPAAVQTEPEPEEDAEEEDVADATPPSPPAPEKSATAKYKKALQQLTTASGLANAVAAAVLENFATELRERA